MAAAKKVREETLRRDTGRGWGDWFLVLARWGTVQKGEADTVRHLRDEYGLTRWLARAIVERYLKDQAKAAAPATKKGSPHDVKLQRTIHATPETVYEAWTRPGHLTRWLTTRARNQLRVGGRYEMAGGTRGRYLELEPPKRLRFTWDHEIFCPGTEVDVTISKKGKDQSVVKVVHRPLATKEDGVRMNEVWSVALDALKAFLEEGGKGDQHLWVSARS